MLRNDLTVLFFYMLTDDKIVFSQGNRNNTLENAIVSRCTAAKARV